MRSLLRLFLACAALVVVTAAPVHAALTPYAAPYISSCEANGLYSLNLRICAGATGAFNGVTLQWMEYDVWSQTGWLSSDDPRLCALSLSGSPSIMHDGKSRWDLAANQCVTLTIGDLLQDETGLSGNDCAMAPLKCGTRYVFRVFAHGGQSCPSCQNWGRSDWSANFDCSTAQCPTTACTYTQGYWKTHGPEGCVTGNNTNQWPASVMADGMLLGTVHYDAAALCGILQRKPSDASGCTVSTTEGHCGGENGAPCTNYGEICSGNKPANYKYCVATTVTNPAWNGSNGLITLAHQLVTAKMNVANGAVCDAVSGPGGYIAQADALIGGKVVPGGGGCDQLDPNAVSTLVTALDAFNNGNSAALGCPLHCSNDICPDPNNPACSDLQSGAGTQTQASAPASTKKASWGSVKRIYR